MTHAKFERCGGLRHARRKPDGGFCFIPAMAILRAWFAYRRAIIRLIDLRVWLACFELTARRYAASKRRRPKYRHQEIHRLIGGVGGQHVRHSIRRLELAGLLTWSESQVRMGEGINPQSTHEGPEFSTMCALVSNRLRKVPVPRRLVRLLARKSRPVLIATALGHGLRCLYYRKGTCRPDGRCKATWVAKVFGVDQRNVKAARRELMLLGVMRQSDDSQFAMNRWGPRIIFILPKCMRPPIESPSPQAESTSSSPPPMNDRNLSSRSDHQKPGQPGRSGPFRKPIPKPSLRNVLQEDLKDCGRLIGLFVESVHRGWCANTEAQKLDFFACAARAVRVGLRNPCGLFATLVRRQSWNFISGADEEQGRKMLRELQFGDVSERVTSS